MSVSLVTGGTEFIGAYVTDELIQMGHTVVMLDDLIGRFIGNANQSTALYIEN
ncbi:MAG: NAD-dependent epimerase/dehydratase family protein [Bacteroidia bacterium]|nr:NAD-dependent epimerase/dehydratase family protein [Bacteroidia bacterium]